MLKRFAMNTLALFVVGFGSASSCHVHAQATGAIGITDLTRVLSGLEEESYRARLSKDTKFWDTFLSENLRQGPPPDRELDGDRLHSRRDAVESRIPRRIGRR
jgi:hypothetical protein